MGAIFEDCVTRPCGHLVFCQIIEVKPHWREVGNFVLSTGTSSLAVVHGFDSTYCTSFLGEIPLQVVTSTVRGFLSGFVGEKISAQ